MRTISLLILFLPFLGNAQKNGSVDWMTWEEAVHAQQNKEAKKIFVDLYTDWCGWCKKMDKTTFSDPKVAEILNEHYYPVKFDAEQKEPVIMGGDTLKHRAKRGRKGTHELAIKLSRGKLSYPTIVFLDEELQLITPIPGYRKAGQMEAILSFFHEDHYKERKDLNKFIKEYHQDGEGNKQEEKKKEEKQGNGKAKKRNDGNDSASKEKKEAKKSTEGIQWMSWEEMVEAQKENPKRIFIDIYTHWCGPCKALDKRTFQDEEVASFINEHFHPVKLDAEMEESVRFKGKTYQSTDPDFERSSKKQRGKPHELALSLVDGRLAYPTMLVLNKGMGREGMIRGYKSPSMLLKELRPLLKEAGEVE